jgi:hypothetical protein
MILGLNRILTNGKHGRLILDASDLKMEAACVCHCGAITAVTSMLCYEPPITAADVNIKHRLNFVTLFLELNLVTPLPE